jgi:hypothetical protein
MIATCFYSNRGYSEPIKMLDTPKPAKQEKKLRIEALDVLVLKFHRNQNKLINKKLVLRKPRDQASSFKQL